MDAHSWAPSSAPLKNHPLAHRQRSAFVEERPLHAQVVPSSVTFSRRLFLNTPARKAGFLPLVCKDAYSNAEASEQKEGILEFQRKPQEVESMNESGASPFNVDNGTDMSPEDDYVFRGMLA